MPLYPTVEDLAEYHTPDQFVTCSIDTYCEIRDGRDEFHSGRGATRRSIDHDSRDMFQLDETIQLNRHLERGRIICIECLRMLSDIHGVTPKLWFKKRLPKGERLRRRLPE